MLVVGLLVTVLTRTHTDDIVSTGFCEHHNSVLVVSLKRLLSVKRFRLNDYYIKQSVNCRYNHTAGGKYEVAVDSCRAWKIEWNLETGYVEHSVPLSSEVDADFVRVSCRIRRVDGAGRTTPEPRNSCSTPGGRKKEPVFFCVQLFST